MRRQSYQLTEAEIGALRSMIPVPTAIWKFWEIVAVSRGLDPKSIIASDTGRIFTALPEGHGKHWCYPYSLHCKRRPMQDAA